MSTYQLLLLYFIGGQLVLLSHQLTAPLLLLKVTALDCLLMRVMKKLGFILMMTTLMMTMTLMMKRNCGGPVLQSMRKIMSLMRTWYDHYVWNTLYAWLWCCWGFLYLHNRTKLGCSFYIIARGILIVSTLGGQIYRHRNQNSFKTLWVGTK